MSILMSSLCCDSSPKMNKIVLSADLIAFHEIHRSPVRVVSCGASQGGEASSSPLLRSIFPSDLSITSFPSPCLGPAVKVTRDGSGGREAEWDSGPEMVGDTGEGERERKGQGAEIKGGGRKSWTGWEGGEWRGRMSEVMEGKLNQGRCCSFIKKSGVLRHDGWFTPDDSLWFFQFVRVSSVSVLEHRRIPRIVCWSAASSE